MWDVRTAAEMVFRKQNPPYAVFPTQVYFYFSVPSREPIVLLLDSLISVKVQSLLTSPADGLITRLYMMPVP